MKKHIGTITLSALLVFGSDLLSDTNVDNDKVNFNGIGTTISVNNTNSPNRQYELKTNASLRDNEPSSKQKTFSEQPGKMSIRTGNTMFDGLFSLAMNDLKEDSVSSIQNDDYNNGTPISAPNENGFFQTGEKWTYVWTRDTSYSVNLALGLADKLRALNSMEFKISNRRDVSGKPEIIQDTGSGGSWPISTDRVIWSLGAETLLQYLDGNEWKQFFNKAYPAIINTIEADRKVVYDKSDGLYRGETSFLDWREQTYPQWTSSKTVHIGMSKALSTNVCHYIILNLASELAKKAGSGDSGKYAKWASDLKDAINKNFWLKDVGLYSMFLTTDFDQAPTHKYDLMGESLAILSGVASDSQAKSTVSNYPNSEVGVPVIFPQQPDTPIYHNRAIWPFATAYYLRAAKKAMNAAAVNHNILSLITASAINLSNMENAEFLTLSNWYNDSSYSGPVVNSQRQLWSVAGYLSMAIDIIYGQEANESGIRFNPFITKKLRNTIFNNSDKLYLYNLPYKNKLIDVTVSLPPSSSVTSGYYKIKGITLNSKNISPDKFISSNELADKNNIEITLEDASTPPGSVNIVKNTGDWREYYAPKDASLDNIYIENGLIKLEFSSNGEQGVVYNIYRNNEKAASGISGNTWIDPNSGDYKDNTYFYAVESQFTDSHKHTSQHSEVQAYWPDESIDIVNAGDSRMTSPQNASISNQHGRECYNNWGTPNDTLVIKYSPQTSGDYSLQIVYANSMGPINTGITCCVKKITVKCDNSVVMESYVVMPHLANWDTWGDSSYSSEFKMVTGKNYQITISDFRNMSYFTSNSTYGGSGGWEGINNRCNLQGIKILKLSSNM